MRRFFYIIFIYILLLITNVCSSTIKSYTAERDKKTAVSTIRWNNRNYFFYSIVIPEKELQEPIGEIKKIVNVFTIPTENNSTNIYTTVEHTIYSIKDENVNEVIAYKYGNKYYEMFSNFNGRYDKEKKEIEEKIAKENH